MSTQYSLEEMVHTMVMLDIPSLVDKSPSLMQEDPSAIIEGKHKSLAIEASAAQRLRILQQKKQNPQLMLRIRIRGGGCSGFQYKFELTDQQNDDDLAFTHEECRFLVDQLSLAMLDGARLEYFTSPIESGFRLDNPQAKSSCGCGISFSMS